MTDILDARHASIAHGSRLDGKVALVTGAGGGLGRSVAQALASAGAQLVLNHRGPDNADLADLEANVARLGPAPLTLTGDMSRGAEVEQLFASTVEHCGKLDIVVHTPGRVTKTPFAETSDAEFEASLDTNVRAAFYVLRAAARRVGDGGRIITLSTSITGVTIPNYGIYAGHKAATEHYVRALAKELGPRGVTVNAVAPGPINSPFYFGVENEESFRIASRMSGAGRLGEWGEIAPLITFLCTPDAQWITAQTVRINGGMTA